MNVLKNHNLNHSNTLKLESICDSYVELDDLGQINDLVKIIKNLNMKYYFLGGGSNLILPPRINALVVKNKINHIEIIEPKNESSDYTFVKVGSGYIWHDFVLWTLKNNYYGLENLSLIPGTVGAAPVQNIGAYGKEVDLYIYQVIGVDFSNGSHKILSNTECEFSYRDSIFKKDSFRNFFISEIIFKFKKENVLEYSYGELKEKFKNHTPNPKEISDVIIEIRKNKLPDLIQFPNAGSFFKNPIIPESQFADLKYHHPQLVSYPYSSGKIKLSAGQLIELCGFKGIKHGPVSMYEKQALVLVNHGNAKYDDVINLAQLVIKSVQSKFQVDLSIEPMMWS